VNNIVKSIISFLSGILIFSCHASAVPSDSLRLKKQETTRTSYNPDGKISGIKIYNSKDELLNFTVNRFNAKAMLTESVCYYPQGKQKTKSKITYDISDSLKIYEEIVTYDISGGITSSASYYYNEKGLMTRAVNCRFKNTGDNNILCDTSDLTETKSADGLTSQTINNYMFFGKKNQMKIITIHDTIKHIDETSTFYNDTLSGKSSMEYDSKGIIIKTSNYSPDGTLLYYTAFIENKSGKVFTTLSYNQHNVLTDKTIIIKDKHKNPLRVLSYNGKEKLTYREEYKYKYIHKDKYSEVEEVKYY
jgi:hypothetical protein